MIYDLIVIGAGPAGCAAAITTAREGASVLLLERGHYPRHKVCGEFVSAESIQLLRSLLGDNAAALLDPAPRISNARLYKGDVHANIPISPGAISITRHDLDSALFRAASLSGATALENTAAASIQRDSDQFVVQTKVEEHRSRTLLIAAGRWSNLQERENSSADREVRQLGIKAHFRNANSFPRDTVELHFFDGGYCGIDSIAQDTVSVCSMVRPDVARNLDQVFALSKFLRARSRNWQPLFEPVTTFPLIFRKPKPEGDGILYAGDAAAFVDPFIGDGISLALNSGSLAARSLAPVWRGECTLATVAARYRSAYEAHFAKVFRNAARIRQLLRLPEQLQIAALSVLRVPAVSRRFISLTRAA